MINSQDSFQLLPEPLKIITNCPVCGVKLNTISAKVIDEKEDAKIVHVQCKKCGSCCIALIYNAGGGVASVGLLTDATADDVMRFKGSRNVTCDDVIEIYNFLEKDENLVQLLK